MPVLVDVKRAAFRQLYASAATQGVTLQAAIATAIAPSLAAALAGKQVVEAQAGGTVTKYQLPAELSAQTPDVAAMWGQLQDLYDRALLPVTAVPPGGGCDTEIAGTPPNPSGTTTAIYLWMISQLTVCRAFCEDHSQSMMR